MIYLFELGHQPHISIEEIFFIFQERKIAYKVLEKKEKKIYLEIEKEFDEKEFMSVLGGTVKIFKFLGNNIKENILDFLQNKNKDSKIVFSVSGQDIRLAKRIGIEIKKEIKKQGRSVRYVEIKNTASVIHNNILEKGGDFLLDRRGVFVTMAVQDFELFSKKDFKRPGVDKISGMLPPKLARIMINLASQDIKKVLLDPYCGSGTVVTEAIDLGFKNIFGIDISKKAIEDTKKNVDWILDFEHLKEQKVNINIFQNDVQELSQKIEKNSIDVIVFEPYMGEAIRGRATEKIIIKQLSELKELYINAFKEFKKVLKKGSVIIGIIPRFNLNNKIFKIECVSDIENIGFKNIGFMENESLVYARPGQVVEREIFKFKI